MQVDRLVFTAADTCEVEPVDLDERIGSQEVLIRNRLGLVSPGTELAIFTGEHRGFEDPNHWAGYPWWPGYCNVGEVEASDAGCSVCRWRPRGARGHARRRSPASTRRRS